MCPEKKYDNRKHNNAKSNIDLIEDEDVQLRNSR